MPYRLSGPTSSDVGEARVIDSKSWKSAEEGECDKARLRLGFDDDPPPPPPPPERVGEDRRVFEPPTPVAL